MRICASIPQKAVRTLAKNLRNHHNDSMRRILYHGVAVDCGTKAEQQQLLLQFLDQSVTKVVITTNPEFVVLAQKNPQLQKLAQTADASLVDGIGLSIALRPNQPQAERYPGADMLLDLCAHATQYHIPVGVVVPDKGLSSPTQVTRALQQTFPGIQALCWKVTEQNIIEKISTTGTQLLFVALGQPTQEAWMLQHKISLAGVRLLIGVGGALDFLTGARKRAPRFLRALGLEWGWRLITQPRRFSRIWRATVQFWLLRFHSSPPNA